MHATLACAGYHSSFFNVMNCEYVVMRVCMYITVIKEICTVHQFITFSVINVLMGNTVKYDVYSDNFTQFF